MTGSDAGPWGSRPLRRVTAPTGLDPVERWRVAALHGPRWRRGRTVRRLAAEGGATARRALAEVLAGSGAGNVRAVAEAALGDLSEPTEIDAVCEVAITTGDARVCDIVRRAGYQPSDPARRALWLLLDGQYDRYAELDFDGTLLRAALRSATPDLRRRLADHARAAGRVEWVRAVADDTGAPRRLTDDEWHTTIRLLTDARRWDDLWERLPTAPLPWARQILTELDGHGWLPADRADHAAFRALLDRARSCDRPLTTRARFVRRRVVGRRRGSQVVGISPRGDLLATTDVPRDQIQLWRLPSGEPAGLLHGKDAHFASSHHFNRVFSPDGTYLVACINGVLYRWDVTTRALVDSWRADWRMGCGALAATVDATSVILGTHHGPVEVSEWPVGADVPTLRFRAGGPGPARLVSTPDGRLLAVAERGPVSPAGQVWLFGLPSWQRIGAVHTEADRILVSPDGRILVTIESTDRFRTIGTARSWQLPTGTPAGSLPDVHPRSASVTPDGRLLITDVDTERVVTLFGGEVKASGRPALWHLPGLEPAGTLDGPRALTGSGVVSPDGSLYAAAVEDPGRTVGIWHLPTRTYLGPVAEELAGASPHRFLPDGGILGSSDRSGPGILDPGPVVLWQRREALVGPRPVADVAPSELADLHRVIGTGAGGDLAWLELLETLVWWRHRHDIAVSVTDPERAPADTDIALDGWS